MKNLEKYETFGLDEGTMRDEHKKYLERIAHYKALVTRLGVEDVDGVYDCHEWVGTVMESGKVATQVEFFLFDEDKESNYYRIAEVLDKEFESAFKKLGAGVWPYFDYVLGHSFIRENGIFIDLTLHTEGMQFEDVQSVCERLSKIDMFHDQI
jgi:hypothetical protein